MRNTAILFIGFLLLTIAPTSNSEEIIRRYTVIGGASCQEWNSSKIEYLKPDTLAIDYLSNVKWAIGYISGINANEAENDILSGISLNTIIDWIDKYCGENPKKDSADALNLLSEKLLKIN